MRIAACLLACLLASTACTAQESEPALKEGSRPAVLSYLAKAAKGPFGERDADFLAKQCGIAVAPILTGIVNDANLPPMTRGAAAMCIGKLGVPESGKTIIEFIEQPLTDPVDTLGEFAAVELAILGLGYMGTDECVSFLQTLCTEDYWASRADSAMFIYEAQPATEPEGRLRPTARSWRNAARAATATLGAPKAVKVVNEARKTDMQADDSADADDAPAKRERRPLFKNRNAR